MNVINRILSVSAAILLFASCSSDTLPVEEPKPVISEADGEGFYMNLDIQMPSGIYGTRSETVEGGGSSSGTEEGSNEENTVSSALIILAASQDVSAGLPKYGFIAASEVQNNHIIDVSAASNSKIYRASAKIQKTNLNQFYEAMNGASGNPSVYVFVFANPTTELVDAFVGGKTDFGDTSWIDMTCEVLQGSGVTPKNIGIWGSNSFLMNNSRLAVRSLPANLSAWDNFNSYDNAFHLSDRNENSVNNAYDDATSSGGAVNIERSVARLDFKDGSPKGDNTYNVLYSFDNDGTKIEDAPIVAVQLFKMAVVNMSNKFYYLPRVSNNGLPKSTDNGFELLGMEKPWSRNPNTGVFSQGNYVVGPYANDFNATVTSGFSTYFNYPFFENDGSYSNGAMATGRWDVALISDVLKGRDDNYSATDDATGNEYKPGDYKVWRYITENVIPVDPEHQVNGISTGIVFKGKLKGAYDKANEEKYNEEYWDEGSSENLSNCLNGNQFIFNGVSHDKLLGSAQEDPILYYYSGRLYLGWRHIRQAAIQAAVTINVSGETEINRSNSLYRAVFGEGAIPDSYKYVLNEKDADGQLKKVDIDDPLWDNKDYQEKYQKSADYLWTVWNAGNESETGRPIVDENGQTPASLVAFRQAATEGGITIYQSSNDSGNDNYTSNDGPGYYCYYYYWNRHNDNGMPGVMGPMEFDVVRNNVYKLSVDKITHLGHPRVPGNDPDHPTPDTPDESDLIYLDVRTLIVPWTVRINGITF